MKELYNKYKEYILYMLFGGLTTAVDLIIYYTLLNLLSVHYLAAQALAWCGSVLFAFATNRRWVFESKSTGTAVLAEMVKFVSGRLFSLGVQTVIMYVSVDMLRVDENIAKLPVMVVVIVLNYIVSKVFVFRGEKAGGEKE